MKNIAIVEDEPAALEVLEEYLQRFGESNKEEFNVFSYPDSFSLLQDHTGKYDIIMLDIMLPDINGMELAHRIRARDKSVAIIFVTNMSQFAVRGYEVDASDFIVKPVSYCDFSTKLKRTLEKIDGQGGKHRFSVTTKNCTLVLDVSDIKWIEVVLHKLIYHTKGGVAETYGSLKKAEQLPGDERFVRANKSVLVNLRYVTSLQNDTVIVDGDIIYLSRMYKRNFYAEFTKYYEEKS